MSSTTPRPSERDLLAMRALRSKSIPLTWNKQEGFVKSDGHRAYQLNSRIGDGARKRDGRLFGFLHQHAAYFLDLAIRDLQQGRRVKQIIEVNYAILEGISGNASEVDVGTVTVSLREGASEEEISEVVVGALQISNKKWDPIINPALRICDYKSRVTYVE